MLTALPDNKPIAWPAAAAWEQALNDVLHALPNDGSPRFRDCQWQKAFAGDAAALFTPLEDASERWSVTLTPDALWKRLATMSQIANLPETDGDSSDSGSAATLSSRAAVRRRVASVLTRDDVVRNSQGEVTIHAVTYYAWTRKATMA